MGSPHARGQRRGGRLRGARPAGERDCYDNEIPRLRFAAFGMTMALGKPPKGMKMDSV